MTGNPGVLRLPWLGLAERAECCFFFVLLSRDEGRSFPFLSSLLLLLHSKAKPQQVAPVRTAVPCCVPLFREKEKGLDDAEEAEEDDKSGRKTDRDNIEFGKVSPLRSFVSGPSCLPLRANVQKETR